MNGLQQNATYLDLYTKTQVRKLLFQTEVDHTAIVKANGYNLGLLKAANSFCIYNRLGVARFEEAVFLRRHMINHPILVMNQILESQFKAIHKFGLSVVVYDLNLLKALSDFSSKTKSFFEIWLKLDTGMHRLGMYIEEIDEVVTILKRSPFLRFKSLMTHFSSADESFDFTKQQLHIFIEGLKFFDDSNFMPDLISLPNSAALFNLEDLLDDDLCVSLISYFQKHPQLTFSTRSGLGLYGHSPSELSSFPTHFFNPHFWHTFIFQVQGQFSFIPVGLTHGFSYEWPFVFIDGHKCLIHSVHDFYSVIKCDFGSVGQRVDLINQVLTLSMVSECLKTNVYETISRIKKSSCSTSFYLKTPEQDQTTTRLTIDLKRLESYLLEQGKRFRHADLVVDLSANAYGHGAEPLLSFYQRRSVSYFLVNDFEVLDSYVDKVNFLFCLAPILSVKRFRQINCDKIIPAIYSLEQLSVLIQSEVSFSKLMLVMTDTYDQRGLSLADFYRLLNSYSDDLKEVQLILFFDSDSIVYFKSVELKALKADYSIEIFCLGSNLDDDYYDLADYVCPMMSLLGFDFGMKASLSWTCFLSQQKFIKKGGFVSYNNTYQADHDHYIGIIPAGYADGFPRAPLSFPHVFINHNQAAVLGRVCMDQSIIYLDEPIDEKQEIVILGDDYDGSFYLKTLGISPLVFHSFLSERLPRFYIGLVEK